MAEVYLDDSQVKNSLKWLEDAENLAQKNREHFFDAEIYRIRGEALFALDKHSKTDVESLLWRAIETARRQTLKTLELRALISLVRIGGRKIEALKLLKETYDWFSEGLDTNDLKKAKDLLGENGSG